MHQQTDNCRDIDSFVAGLNDSVDRIAWYYSLDQCHKIKINADEIRFPTGLPGAGSSSPDRWLRLKHADGNIHEPGLIATISFLSELAGNQKVQFVDLGAYFGYFSAIAAELFEQIEVYSVEANPGFCQALTDTCDFLKKSGHDINPHNLLISDDSGPVFVSAHNFTIRSIPDQGVEEQLLKKAMASNKNLNISKLNNIFQIQAQRLEEFLPTVTQSPNSQLILKIDTEGYQTSFLPPAVDYLASRNAIILLEFDRPEKMADEAVNNKDVCQLFWEKGFQLIWMDHRKEDARAIFLDEVAFDDRFEKNSLGILVPNTLFTA